MRGPRGSGAGPFRHSRRPEALLRSTGPHPLVVHPVRESQRLDTPVEGEFGAGLVSRQVVGGHTDLGVVPPAVPRLTEEIGGPVVPSLKLGLHALGAEAHDRVVGVDHPGLAGGSPDTAAPVAVAA